MPLTIAHPVAAVPLRRPLGRLGVLAGLVVGSIMADLPLFMPLPLSRNTTHSFPAVLWFCVPAGVLAYLLYDCVLDRPLRALMPEGLARRLARTGREARPPVWSPSVLVSIFVGAATHAVWDSFTHGGSAGVGEWLPFLERRLFTVSGYTAYVFSVLQHVSTVVGMAALSLWVWRWYGRATPGDPADGALSPRARRALFIVMVLAMVAGAIAAAAIRPPAEATIRHLQPVVRRVVVTSLSTLLGAVTIYAIAWHSLRRRGRL